MAGGDGTVAQMRLEAFEQQARRAVQELVEKGLFARRDVATILQNARPEELLEGLGAEASPGEAGRLELAHLVARLRAQLTAVSGVASREQLESLTTELDRLSRRLESVLSEPSAATPPADRNGVPPRGASGS